VARLSRAGRVRQRQRGQGGAARLTAAAPLTTAPLTIACRPGAPPLAVLTPNAPHAAPLAAVPVWRSHAPIRAISATLPAYALWYTSEA
jgi:hypothetical protein